MKMMRVSLAAIAALALALAGCTTAPSELTTEQKNEVFSSVLVDAGLSPELVDLGRELALETCDHADEVGAVRAVTDVFKLTNTGFRETQEAAAVALGAGIEIYCPEHSWAFTELAK